MERIEADVEPLQPRRVQQRSFFFQKDAVGRHRNIERRIDRGDHGGEILDALAHQWLAAGQSNRADTRLLDQDAGHPNDLLEGEDLFAGQPGQPGRRHAVNATEVTAVRDRDPQVIGDAPEGVAEMDDRFRTGHEISIWGVQLGVMPPFTPMEAKVQAELPRGDAWQYEPKWDGFRAVAFKDGDEVVIHSRNSKPLTRYFPELVPAIQAIKAKRAVLDGEIVIFSGYGTDFDAMQLRIHPAASRVNMLAKEQPSTYIAFDLLADGDESLLDKPLRERRQRLEKLLGPKPESIYLSPVTGDRDVAISWLKEYRGTGLDGIVAKRIEGIYKPGERAMIKVKEQRTADVVVGGFRWGNDGKRVGSLLLGVYRGKTFEFIGHTSGFDDAERRDLVSMLEPLRGGTSFEGGRAPGGPSRWSQDRDLSWEPVRPELVCEVAFDRLENGRFRHGVGFVRWRPDKNPKSCTLAQLKAEASVELKKLFA